MKIQKILISAFSAKVFCFSRLSLHSLFRPLHFDSRAPVTFLGWLASLPAFSSWPFGPRPLSNFSETNRSSWGNTSLVGEQSGVMKQGQKKILWDISLCFSLKENQHVLFAKHTMLIWESKQLWRNSPFILPFGKLECVRQSLGHPLFIVRYFQPPGNTPPTTISARF